jgi:dTDP-glucose 4,6-dehydratase
MHLAGETHVDRSFADPETCAITNVNKTLTFVARCSAYARAEPSQLGRFLYMSTDEIYGDDRDHACREEEEPRPTNPYSASKAAAEQFVRAFVASAGFPAVIARPNNVYGPRQTRDKALPLFVERCMRRATIPIHGAGQQRRSWLHADDACRALWLIVTRGRVGQAYNIASSDEVSVLDLAIRVRDMVERLRPATPRRDSDNNSNGRDSDSDMPALSAVEFVRDRPHNDRHYRVDCTKLSCELGWQQQTPFAAGLERTVAWHIQRASRDHVVPGTKAADEPL